MPGQFALFIITASRRKVNTESAARYDSGHILRAKYNKEVFSWRELPCTSVRASEEVGIETEKQRFLPRRAGAIGGTAGTRLGIVNKLLKQPVRFLGGFTVDFLSIDGVQ